MAKETKSLTCAPESESDLIEIWQTFGWELFSTQEVRDTESHLEQGFGDTINSVTTTYVPERSGKCSTLRRIKSA